MKVNRELFGVARKLYNSGVERKTIKKWVKYNYGPFSKFLNFRKYLEKAANKLDRLEKEKNILKEYINESRAFLNYMKLKDLHYFIIYSNNMQQIIIEDYNLKTPLISF